jgi:hypothetical protein
MKIFILSPMILLAALVGCGQPGPVDSADGQPSASVGIPTVAVAEGHMVVLTLSDAAATREHLADSLLARAWHHPSMAAWRTALLARLAEEDERRPNFARLYNDLASFRLSAGRAEKAGDYLAMQFDCGPYADTFMTRAFGGGTVQALEPLPAGAQKGVTWHDETLVQYGTVLVMSEDLEPLPAPQTLPALGNWDAHARIDLNGLLRESRLSHEPLPLPYRSVDAFLRLLSTGSEELWAFDGPARSRQTVDLSLLDHFGADRDLVLALGLDGQVLWNDGVMPMLAADNGGGERELEQAADALKALGLTDTPMDLLAELKGTLLLALKEGDTQPMPELLLAIPRAPKLDQLLAALLGQMQRVAPAPGETLDLPLPGMPLVLTILADENHWVIASSAAQITTWRQGGDWARSPTGRAAIAGGGDLPLAIAGLNAPAILARWAPRLAAQASTEGAHPIDVGGIVGDLASTAAPNWLAVTEIDGRLCARFGGAVGGPGTWAFLGLVINAGDELFREARKLLPQAGEAGQPRPITPLAQLADALEDAIEAYSDQP